MSTYGCYDIVICSGILYHLTAPDAAAFIETLSRMASDLLIVDTHIALEPKECVVYKNREYWGRTYREHSHKATQEKKAKDLWASWDNATSFWFTRPSLVNLLTEAGFSSVYECFAPPHINFGRPGIESLDRCTFVALKGKPCRLQTSPAADAFHENWPEGTLSYGPQPKKNSLLKYLLAKIRRN